MSLDTMGKWLGVLLVAGYGALVALELVRYFRSALAAPDEAPDAPSARASRRIVWLWVLGAFAVSRLLVALVCAIAYRVEGQGLEGFLRVFYDKLFPWDARHYIHIIENGYVNFGDEALFIVFFPFFPLLCRNLTFITGMSAEVAAFTVSNAALLASGAVLWRLAELDGGEAVGRRAMLLLMFCPVTYFYSISYSESTFLLVTLLAVYCARQRRFPLAVLFGAMAANTRVLGMATAIPIFWELLRREREGWGSDMPPKSVIARRIGLCVLKVLPVALGFMAYLCVNWRLFGTPTQFMVFQREHWFQQFGDIGNTFRYSLVNALQYDDILYRYGVWWPQVILLPAVPLLVFFSRKRERPGDTAYALVYHYVAFAPTWLLSGLRYASCSYALYPMLARLPKKRLGFILMLTLEIALLAGATWLGLWKTKIY